MPSPKSVRAFTLIELLVVVAISAFLSAIAITYSSIGRNQVALSVEEAKIVQMILQAKSLSIATYGNGATSCGYGFLVDAATQTYSIFSYDPSGAPPCPAASTITTLDANAEQSYTQGTWQVPVSNGVKIEPQQGFPNLKAVLFYPPDPAVFLSEDNQTIDQPSKTLYIYLATADGKSTATISINPEGQVNLY